MYAFCLVCEGVTHRFDTWLTNLKYAFVINKISSYDSPEVHRQGFCHFMVPGPMAPYPCFKKLSEIDNTSHFSIFFSTLSCNYQ